MLKHLFEIADSTYHALLINSSTRSLKTVQVNIIFITYFFLRVKNLVKFRVSLDKIRIVN